MGIKGPCAGGVWRSLRLVSQLAVLHQIKFSTSDCKVQDHQVLKTHTSSPGAREDSTCITERWVKVKDGLRVLNYVCGYTTLGQVTPNKTFAYLGPPLSQFVVLHT